MDLVGDAYDNAVKESFFAALETELLDRVCASRRAGMHGWQTSTYGARTSLRFVLVREI